MQRYDVNIKYVNHKGAELPLSVAPFILDPAGLFNYEWSYSGVNYGNRGGKVEKFYKDIQEKSLTFYVTSSTKAEFNAHIKTFFEVVEIDVIANIPGRIMLDTDEYLHAYVYGTSKQFSRTGLTTLISGISVVLPTPFWTKDVKFSFSPESSSGGGGSDDGLDYPYDYPYDYSLGVDIQTITNDSVSGSEFEMIVYGPVTNPEITIGPNTYTVNTVLYVNEYLMVNSRDKTIVRHKPNGEQVNVFEFRSPSVFFVPIPPGESVIESNAFFDLVMYQERSEPTWNL
ncbi:MAG: hypothetical protein LBQ21_07435 [Clostridiales Family XIII bacterium]|nr:hypothetical protein [Clostridiales Family XIII bacterium]